MPASDTTLPQEQREQLRREWIQRAGQAFDRMFAQEHQPQLITFTQRETRAMDVAGELAQWLVEEHLAADVMARPSETPDTTKPCCPKCGKPGLLVTEVDDPLPQRDLVSRAGQVQLEREQYRCTACRVVFFPLG